MPSWNGEPRQRMGEFAVYGGKLYLVVLEHGHTWNSIVDIMGQILRFCADGWIDRVRRPPYPSPRLHAKR